MNDFVELRQIIMIVLRRWWLVLGFVVVATGVGYLFGVRQAPVYQARTTIAIGELYQATELSRNDITTVEFLAATYANMATRNDVLQNVIDTLNLDESASELMSRIRADLVDGSQLITIRVEADSPEEAQRIAAEITNQLVLMSPTNLQKREDDENAQFVRMQLKTLQANIEAGQAQRQLLEQAKSVSLNTKEIAEFQAEINTLDRLLADLGKNYAQMLGYIDQNISPNSLTIIAPAEARFSPVRPTPRRDAAVAGVLGLIVALGIIFAQDFLDQTVKSEEGLSKLLGLPVLGVIRRMRGKKYQDHLVLAHDAFAPVTEAYRKIRSNIQYASVNYPIKTIMVTSADSGEGKSITVANLGIIMAQAGFSTIIVDADLRRPSQHDIFQVPNNTGLTDLLRLPIPNVNHALLHTRIENLHLLPCGSLSLNPAELLGSQRMDTLIAELSDLADVVIFDSSPILPVTDATTLASRVDGVMLVVKSKKTHREAAERTLSLLRQAGANVLGSVLNSAPPTREIRKTYYSRTVYKSADVHVQQTQIPKDQTIIRER